MNLDTLLPVLDALSKFAETMPYPYVAFGGVVLGALVLVFRKWKGIKAPAVASIQAVTAEAPALKVVPVVPDATLEDITKKSLDPK